MKKDPTLKIERSVLVDLFDATTDTSVKEKLKKKFGVKMFEKAKSENDFTGIDISNITKWEHVEKINKNAKDRPYKSPKTNQHRYFNQMHRIDCIIETLKKGAKLSFANSHQKKWWAWIVWDEEKAGFVFGVSSCNAAAAVAGLGPRLCFESEETMKHFVKYFMDEINTLMKFN